MAPPLGFLAACMLAACAGPTGPALMAPAAAPRAFGTVSVRQPHYALQDAAPAAGIAVLPFAKQHLVKVELYLARVVGGLEQDAVLADTLVAGGFARQVRFETLAAGGTYRVRAKAWQPEDARDAATLVEAQDDAASLTAFTVVGDQVLDLDAQGGILLTLKDRTFQGRAPGGIAVQAGSYDSTGTPEGMVAP